MFVSGAKATSTNGSFLSFNVFKNSSGAVSDDGLRRESANGGFRSPRPSLPLICGHACLGSIRGRSAPRANGKSSLQPAASRTLAFRYGIPKKKKGKVRVEEKKKKKKKHTGVTYANQIKRTVAATTVSTSTFPETHDLVARPVRERKEGLCVSFLVA